MTAYQDLKDRQAQRCTLRYLGDGSADRAGDEPEIEAILTDVSECRVGHGYEHFALLFRVAGDTAPRQGTYAVTLPELATEEWFLVPIGKNKDGLLYEATFNRLAPGADPV